MNALEKYERALNSGQVVDELEEWVEDVMPKQFGEEDIEEWAFLSEYVRVFGESYLLFKFVRGVWLLRFPMEYGEKTQKTKMLADRWGTSYTTLMREKAAAKFFSENVRMFWRFVRSIDNCTWSHVRKVTGMDWNPELLGPEEMGRLLVENIEQDAERIQRTNQVVGENGEVDEQHVKAAAAAWTEEAVEFRDKSMQVFEGGEEKISKMYEEYKAFVKRLNCMGCGDPPPNDPHHVETHGSGKGSDGALIPVCRTCHRYLESNDPKAFKQETGTSILEALARTLHMWAWGEDIIVPKGA